MPVTGAQAWLHLCVANFIRDYKMRAEKPTTYKNRATKKLPTFYIFQYHLNLKYTSMLKITLFVS